ncbi:hypothetical protein NX059_012173 [Plenodomus lindquistii]|nr:hypothetical protein NX059_012173 [Plenodomus lindquistii]
MAWPMHFHEQLDQRYPYDNAQLPLQPTGPGPAAPEPLTTAQQDVRDHPMFGENPFYEYSQPANEQVEPEPTFNAIQTWYGDVPLTTISVDSPIYTPPETDLFGHFTRTPGWDTFLPLGAIDQAKVYVENEAPFLHATTVQGTYGTLAKDTSLISNFGKDTLPGTRNDSIETVLVPPSLQQLRDESSHPSDTNTDIPGEETISTVRTHILYQQAADKDGYYHCPKEGQSKCDHKPTKRKCDYDKYVDSHIKPFRCNNKACDKISFSSNACLLRHKREAHGVHGPSSGPHLCEYKGCERAAVGHGFARRYNLLDHMKRVHQHESSAAIQPPATHRPVRPTVSMRKRKASTTDTEDQRQRAAKHSCAQQVESHREQLTHAFCMEKQRIIDILTRTCNPNDLPKESELVEMVAHLYTI